MIDRAGHYELLTRLVAGAQQIELGAADSPFALNPWDVPDPASVSREKVAFLLSLHTLMMGDEGLGKAEHGRCSARRSAPSTRAPRRSRTSAPRESMLRDELLAMADYHQRDGAARARRAARAASPRA